MRNSLVSRLTNRERHDRLSYRPFEELGDAAKFYDEQRIEIVEVPDGTLYRVVNDGEAEVVELASDVKWSVAL